MLKAMFKTLVQSDSPQGSTGPCDLAGEWLPCRHDEWYNRVAFGKHKKRARAGHTKVTYDSSGKGSGRVGEFHLHYKVTTVAPGQYTATAKILAGIGMGWFATDGNLTILDDGTLHVQYPSSGVTEYWRRADGRGAEILRAARAGARAAADPSRPSRPVKLAIRHFGPKNPLGSIDLCWHWGLCVGKENSCYEVNGLMVVIGPKGIIAASSPLAAKFSPTHLSQYDGVVTLPHTTQKSDEEIEVFTRQWVKKHPVYLVAGPNCQTYAEDLFTFLTGDNMPFAKSANRIDTFGRGSSPEHHGETHWMKPGKRPR